MNKYISWLLLFVSTVSCTFFGCQLLFELFMSNVFKFEYFMNVIVSFGAMIIGYNYSMEKWK